MWDHNIFQSQVNAGSFLLKDYDPILLLWLTNFYIINTVSDQWIISNVYECINFMFVKEKKEPKM